MPDLAERYVISHKQRLEDGSSYLFSDHCLVEELVFELKNRLRPGAKVLEVGCGGGHAAALMTRQGLKVTAIDFSPVALAQAKENYPSIDFRVADATDLRALDGPFDAVVAVELIEHLEHPEEHIAAVGSILRDQGLYFIKTPNKLWHDLFYLGHPEVHDWHPSVLTASRLALLLEAAGFRPRFIEMKRLPAYQLKKILAKLGPIARLAGPLLGRFPLSLLPASLQPSLICVAVKEK